MKNLILFSVLMVFANIIWSQDMNLTIKVLDTKLKPMLNTKVSFIEIYTRELKSATTDNQGIVKFTISGGKTWQIEILDIKNYFLWQIDAPEEGTLNIQRTLTYDYDKYIRDMKPPFDRSKLVFALENHENLKTPKPDNENCVIKITLIRKNNNPVKNCPVDLTCYKLAKKFRSKTNAAGTAVFKVPIGNTYQIDIDDIENFDVIIYGNDYSGTMQQEYVYEPKNFTEEVVNGTIIQKLPNPPSATSGRHLLSVMFFMDGQAMINSKVKLKDNTKSVYYEAYTNEQGIAHFMVPIGSLYVYPLSKIGDFETYIKVADITRSFGIGTINKEIYLNSNEKVRVTKVKFSLADKTADQTSKFQAKKIKIENFVNNSIPYFVSTCLFFEDPNSYIGMKKGLLMTTGSVMNAIGPNDATCQSAGNSIFMWNNCPESMLDADNAAFDPCIIDFDVTSSSGVINLQYIFASEEYPEFIDYDDSFGIFIDGPGYDRNHNQALIPETQEMVSVKMLNHIKNEHFYRANDVVNSNEFVTWQYDGFSKLIERKINVKPNVVYHIKLILFDRRDNIYDSGVFFNITGE